VIILTIYSVPNNYYFRIHHPRPRFKGDIENVLIYMASEIVNIGEKKTAEFNATLNQAIKLFPGNYNRAQKTINNWRTEIDALFSLIESNNGKLRASYRARELAEHQDLVKFFKLFCYHFQYPGGFVKPHVNLEYINKKIDFKPAQYIINMLYIVEKNKNIRAGITKTEATHCIFNDLRVTRDHRSVEDTWALIEHNRGLELDYDWTGDVIRYAGDILDYLTQANMLRRQPNGKYYINNNESLAIQRFIAPSEEEFNYYEKLPHNVTLQDIKYLEDEWIKYFNTPRNEEFFDTDILALIADDTSEYEELKETFDLSQILREIKNYSTGNIGVVGETLTITHEKNRLEQNDRPDLVHLIKFIPTHLAIGFDISSREIDGSIRNIEVKTTSSSKDIIFTRFHLTPNEWAVAESYQDRYYVYRLMISKESIKLYVIQNPVKKYKEDLLKALPRNGMDITFIPNNCGFEEQLLI
jgi:hypothetical protein